MGQCAGWYPSMAPFPYPFYPPLLAFPYSTAFRGQFQPVPPAQSQPAQAPDSGLQSGGCCSGQTVEPMLGEGQQHPGAPIPCPAEDASLWTAARVQAWLGSIDAEVGTADGCGAA